MKTILVDAVHCFVSEDGHVFEAMREMLDSYSNKKVILTGANDEQFKKFGLENVPYEVFTLKHDPEKTDPLYYRTFLERYHLAPDDVVYFEHASAAADSAKSVGIETYVYDNEKKDLVALKKFLTENL